MKFGSLTVLVEQIAAAFQKSRYIKKKIRTLVNQVEPFQAVGARNIWLLAAMPVDRPASDVRTAFVPVLHAALAPPSIIGTDLYSGSMAWIADRCSRGGPGQARAGRPELATH